MRSEALSRPDRGSSRWVSIGLLTLCALLFFYRLGAVGLFDVDEAVFAEASREMALEGDWITPHYNQENRYDKPILIYWLMGAAYTLFGVSEFSARLVSATLATGLVTAVYLVLRASVVGRFAPILSALSLGTSLEVILLGRAAITDMTLTFFISLSLLLFFWAYRHPDPSRGKIGYLLVYAAMALAVLTKGPVGVVIPGGVIVLFLLIVGRFREVLRESMLLPGIAVFIAVAAPWYILEFQANGKEFWDAFFVKHNFSRYTGVISGHGGPATYFIPVILLGFFPWSPFLPWALSSALRPTVFRALRAGGRQGHLPIFAAVWFSLVFLFFSFSGTKLPGYILPLFPAMAILVGWWWEQISGGSHPPLVGRSVWGGMGGPTAFLVGLGILLAGVSFASPVVFSRIEIPDTLDMAALREMERGLLFMGGAIAAGIVGFLLLLRWSGPVRAVGALTAMMMLWVLVITHQILPAADRALQAPLRELAQEAGDLIRTHGGRLMVYGINKPSLIFYSREYAAVYIREKEGSPIRRTLENGPTYLITTREEIGELPPLQVLRQGGGYILATIPQ